MTVIKKTAWVIENMRLPRVIIEILILTILLASTFDAISDTTPVKASAINIALSGVPNIDYELNGDLRSNGGIMPKNLYMVCSGGKFQTSKEDCVAGQWADIEVVISANSYTAMYLTNIGNLNSSIFQEKRRARCTAKNSNTMDCIWESNFDINLAFSPSLSISSIESQSLNLHVEPTDNASASLQQINISGDLIYQAADYAVRNQGYTTDVPASVSFYVKYNILQSSFGTQTGPATGARPGSLSLMGNMPTTVSLYPEQLDASFSKTERAITSTSKKFTGPGNNELLAEIYLNYGLLHCQAQSTDSICGQLLASANVSVACSDHNVTIATNMCNTGNGRCNGDETWKIAELYGTWGRVNIDTNCAITVLLPYE